jgi:hypothetical protein
MVTPVSNSKQEQTSQTTQSEQDYSQCMKDAADVRAGGDLQHVAGYSLNMLSGLQLGTAVVAGVGGAVPAAVALTGTGVATLSVGQGLHVGGDNAYDIASRMENMCQSLPH